MLFIYYYNKNIYNMKWKKNSAIYCIYIEIELLKAVELH